MKVLEEKFAKSQCREWQDRMDKHFWVRQKVKEGKESGEFRRSDVKVR